MLSSFHTGVIITLLSFLVFSVEAEVVLPYPNGLYEVGLIYTSLVDPARDDPFAPTPRPRSLMSSVFYPVTAEACSQKQTVPYMPPQTAAFEDEQFARLGIPNGTFEQLGIHICPQEAPIAANGSFPTVIFSPALGFNRFFYQNIAQNIAAAGYVVVLIDHAYDADIVEFLDGSVVTGIDLVDGRIDLAVDTRAADARFVIDLLNNLTTTRLFSRAAASGLDARRVAMFGHSLGGAATAATMLSDSRVLGGVNFDGSLFGPVVNTGLDRPLLLWGREEKNVTDDLSWAAIWRNLRGPKFALTLDRSQHLTFSDLPLLTKILGLADKLPSDASRRLGTLDGERVSKIIAAYGTAFVDFVLRGINSTLLQSPSMEYPEVKFYEPGSTPGYKLDQLQ